LFPRYFMGIQLKGKSIELINKERTQSNLLLIILADFIFILGAFVVFRNIRKEMKLTIIKSDFISNVSHEIRTPLALISMYIETLEMDRIKSEEKKKEYYRVIFNETHRLSGLVNKILNFSKIESGKRKYAFELINLNDIVDSVVQPYKFHLKNKGFELKSSLANDLGSIYIDREAISECIANLFDNAIKYSRESKFIEIKTGKSGDFIFFEITDKGIGIPKTDQKLIFDKFFRVSKGDNVHDVKGTGLGLTIVKNIIDAHKGKIEVDSKPGEGSTFRILLPVKR
jgi:two-component system, OmpR family, phosphate regulon sensor histidine kinase PhoR